MHIKIQAVCSIMQFSLTVTASLEYLTALLEHFVHSTITVLLSTVNDTITCVFNVTAASVSFMIATLLHRHI